MKDKLLQVYFLTLFAPKSRVDVVDLSSPVWSCFILGRLLFCLISLLDFEFLFLIQTKKVCCAPTGFNIWANLVPNKHFVQPDLNQDSVKGGKREGNSSYNHNAEVCKKKTLFVCQRRWKMVQSKVI